MLSLCRKKKAAPAAESESLLIDGELYGASNKPEQVGGQKNINFFGGVSLLVNNMTGSGLVTIPLLWVQAGWIVPVITFFAIMIISSIAAAFLCEAMSRIPGNDRFQGRIEFTTLAKHYLPKWMFYIVVVLFVVSLMSFLITSVVISAQTMDLTLIEIFKKSYAIEFYPKLGIAEVSAAGSETSPFGNSVVLSLGYVIVLAVTIPMGYLNLDDNIIIQNGAVIFLVVIFIEWFVNFFIIGLDFSRVPAVTTNLSAVLGTVIFNYAFVITVPSWVNEKKEGVGIQKTIWLSTFISTLFYISIGFFGAWALTFDSHQDILDGIVQQAHGPKWLHVISKVSVYLFPIVALLSSIPVYSIIIRYNLVENHVCRKLPLIIYIVAARAGHLSLQDASEFSAMPKVLGLNGIVVATGLSIFITLVLLLVIAINIVQATGKSF